MKPRETEKIAGGRPDLFTYESYRLFLRDYYRWRKSEKRAFSFRFFSRTAGFKSPNFIQLVMAGKRNLTPESLRMVLKAVKLNREEESFFRKLVSFNQAKSIEEKQHFARRLLRSKRFRELKPLAQAQYHYWSSWYNVAIREMAGLPGFREEPEWIAKNLCPRITIEEASKALHLLVDLGILKRNAEGRLTQAESSITSGDQVTSTWVAQFHQEMLQKARESLDRFEPEDRQISSVTLKVSREHREEIKDMINRFRKEILAVVDEKPMPEDEVYQINFQLFPLTKKSDETESKK